MPKRPPENTIEELKRNLALLKLGAMLAHLDEALESASRLEQGYVSFLANLVGKEVLTRSDAATERRIKAAGFPAIKTFDSFDWAFQKTLNLSLVKDLMHLGFIRDARPVLMLGKPGTGKTHLSIAYGVLACHAGYRVRFLTASRLLKALYASLADASTEQLVAGFAKHDLLIIDELRDLTPIRPEYATLLFELVCSLYEKKALILSSNLDVKQWGRVLGNPVLTTALVDRLMHRAHVINIRKGKSFRSEGPDAPPELDRPVAESEGAED